MPLYAIPFPAFDPVLVSFGPIAIRWYALAYIAASSSAGSCARDLREQPCGGPLLDRHRLDDFLLWATLGVILGGRLGYVLFYKPGILCRAIRSRSCTLWEGGMSFHGGFLGVVARDRAVRVAQQGRSIPAGATSLAIVGADRPVLRPPRQLHQRRAVGPRHRRAVGHGLPARRPAAAPSQPALRGLLRGRAAVPGR